MNEDTSVFDVNLFKRKLVSITVKEVCEALKERGYNPINQLVGYITSGDPGYISNYKDSRTKILEFERAELTAVILEEYINKL